MRLFRLFAVIALLSHISPGLRAEGYALSLDDGTTISGEFISASDTGLILRGPDGRLTRSITWFKLTQESLKKLEGHPKAGKYVELLIDPPPGQEPSLTPPPLELKEPHKPPRPEKVSLAAGMFTPAGMAMLLVLLLANVFAAYEIALYRSRKVGMVIGVSAVLPVIGPLIFLCMPTRRVEVVSQPAASPSGPLPETASAETEPQETPPQEEGAGDSDSMPQETYGEAAPAEEESAAPPPNRMVILDDDEEAPSPGLRLAKRENVPQKADPNYLKTWKRGEQPLNRRFFESNFSGFFKISPPPPECDLRIILKTARGTYIGERISRMANDDLHLQKRAGDASNDIPIPFADILEVTVRHKDTVH